MPSVNPLYRRSRLSGRKFHQILHLFAQDLPASDIAALAGVSRWSVNAIVLKIRTRLAEDCARTGMRGASHVEVDESYFGPRLVRGRRGRGARKKTPVVGLFERNRYVYTEIVPACSKAILQRVIRGKVPLDSVIYTDHWRGYDGLIDIGYQKHFRVRHSENEFALPGGNTINGIEAFWSMAKRRLQQFNGIQPHMFYLHLKEYEWRFNQRKGDLDTDIIALLQAHPL